MKATPSNPLGSPRSPQPETTLDRRRFLGSLGALSAFSVWRGETPAQPGPNQLVGVTGSLSSREAGVILPHEHVMSLFGAEQTDLPQYDREALLGTVLPYLAKLGQLGCGTVVDCTTAYFGRDPLLLREISEATGIKILTNTGYYAAAEDRYVPPHAFRESPEQLAARWVQEWKQGIGDTGIRPGFIKTGVDAGPLSEIDSKMIRAAALTHRETGLTIAAHTANNPDAVAEQLAILRAEGVSPTAWIWVHAHSVDDPEQLLPAAREGAWIELDGVSPENSERHFELLRFLREHGHGSQILLSHDGNSFRYGGRPAKPYDGLFTTFIPILEARGLNRQEIQELISGNPFRALVPGVRHI